MKVKERQHISEEEQICRKAIGELFHHQYQVVRCLGRGGQSQVYCGKRLSNGKYYAIKHVKPGCIVDIEENIRILSRLQHPQLPRFYDIRVRGDEAYIVQDYFPGDNLKKVLQDNRYMHTRVHWRTAMKWMLSACEPLEFMHNLRPAVLHCDVKPANLVLRSSDQRICLMDFDISREAAAEWETARAMSMAYASPEQKQFQKLDQRTDIYSLGVTIHQLATNCLPGERLIHWPLPFRVQKLLNKCTALNPDARFQSIAELRRALLEIL